LISLLLGTAIGQSYDGTVVPLVAGFAILSVLAMIAVHWAEPSRRADLQSSPKRADPGPRPSPRESA
jgi:DHA1 family bicyclomycin/chloramphenicol resistance-like MFS transporter